MASMQLFTAPTSTEEQFAETLVEGKPAAEETRRGFWWALRWRAQNIFWNYMDLQGQLGLYGSTDELGDT